MKLFISVDMEGMAGITAPFQEKEEVPRFRQSLHNQIRWIIDGIHASSCNSQIEEITIADSHGSGTNLSYDELSAMDERISLVSGSPRKHFMMSCLDASYDVVFLAGYHAGPGEPSACMDHSFYGKVVSRMTINGSYMNETTANAALAGDYGVPVGLVIGDSGLRRQLIDQNMMPWVAYVTTKESLSRYAAKFVPQKQLRQNTMDAVKQVLESDLTAIPLYRIEHPVRLAFDFKSTAMADVTAQLPGVTRVTGTGIQVTCRDMTEAECAVSAITALAGTA